MASFAPPGMMPYVPRPAPPPAVISQGSPQPSAAIKLSNGVTLTPMAVDSSGAPPQQAPITLSNGVTLAPMGGDEMHSADPDNPITNAMNAQTGPITPIDDATKLPKIEATFAASFPKNPAAKAQYLATKLFPDQSPNDALKRMGFDGNRYYYIANDGKAYYAEPKMAPMSAPAQSLAELPDWLASGAGPSLPAIGGMAGGIAGGPEPGSVVTAAGGAMLGDAMRQAGARYFTGELQGLVPGETSALKEGAEAGARQALGLGLAKVGSKLLDRNPLHVQYYDVKSLTPAKIQDIQNNVDLAQSMGIDVTPGEAGKVRSLLANQRQLGRQPEAMTTLGDFYDARNTVQLPNAFDNVMSQISPNGASAVANRDLGAAAGDTIKAGLKERSALASNLYDQAFEANPSVATPHLDRILATPAGKQALKETATDMQNGMTLLGTSDPELTELKNELVKMGKMADPKSKGVAAGLKMQTYDLIKQKLYDLEQGAKNADGSPSFASANISKLRQSLTNELDKADATAVRDKSGNIVSPGFYQQARNTYQAASPPVTDLQKGIVGIVAKPKGSALQNLPKVLFSAQSSDPFSITQAKAAFQKAGKMDEWNAGVRSFLQNTWDDATTAGARSDAGPAKPFWDQIAGNPRQVSNLKAALGSTQYEALDSFMKVAKMVRNGVKYAGEGSATATDIGARGKLAGPGIKAVSAVIRGIDPFNIPGDIAAKISDVSSGKNAEALANLITNPQATATLRKLKVLSPGSRQWVQQIGYLGSLLGAGSMKSALMPQPAQAPGEITGPDAQVVTP